MTKSLLETELPPETEMYNAVSNRDSEYEGIFFFAVRTTGIFCRPSCSAKTPNRENIQYFRNASDALSCGFRPCKRCHPLEVFGAAPNWMVELLAKVERDPTRRWTDEDLRNIGIQPEKARRWFKSEHGMTFQAYLRSRRLGLAMGQIQVGKTVTGAAFDSGYQSLSGFREAFKKWCGENPKTVRTDLPPLTVNRILTPLGPMVAAVDESGVWLLEFADRRMLETQFKRLVTYTQRAIVNSNHERLDQLAIEIDEYFKGKRMSFKIPVHSPGSDFQNAVWNELKNIPYGQTISYETLAKRIGRPKAQRAVGRANGDNRLAIIIPCHRVIRSDGTLSGYGGGVWRKQSLLDLEVANA